MKAEDSKNHIIKNSRIANVINLSNTYTLNREQKLRKTRCLSPQVFSSDTILESDSFLFPEVKGSKISIVERASLICDYRALQCKENTKALYTSRRPYCDLLMIPHIDIQKIRNNEIYIKLARRVRQKVAKTKSFKLKGLSNMYKRRINKDTSPKKSRKFNFLSNATFTANYIKSEQPQTSDKEQLIRIFKLGKEFIVYCTNYNMFESCIFI